VTVDYQTDDLCQYSGPGSDDASSARLHIDELLAEALDVDIARKAISRIFRDKLGGHQKP
jgi:hypothetical protein